MRRREFLGTSLAGAGALALGAGFWRSALVAEARTVETSYGALQAADANGFRLPPGFSSRPIARAGEVVPGTGYPWHVFSDGQATYAAPDGGWILVSNSESLAAAGAGSSAIRFAADGSVADAYRILGGTNATARAARRRGAPGSPARSTSTATCGSAIRPSRARASSARRLARSTTRRSPSIPAAGAST